MPRWRRQLRVGEGVLEAVRGVAVGGVGAHALGDRHEDGADVEEEDRVDEAERDPVQAPDVHVVRQRHQLHQHVGHQIHVQQYRALALPRLPQASQAPAAACVACTVGALPGADPRGHVLVPQVDGCSRNGGESG